MEKILLEVIPPPVSWSPEKVAQWTQDICSILKREHIHSLNLPEVIDEIREGKGKRSIPFVQKMDNVTFCQYLRQKCNDIIPIINKIPLLLEKEDFIPWIETVYDQGIRHIILVGGEDRSHPGYSVIEAAQIVKQRYPDIILGGITIFTRTHEAQRLLKKYKSGIEFFCSQIIFETTHAKSVMKEFSHLCQNEGLPLPPFYISLSPAIKHKDIEYMEWLGVDFPPQLHSLTENTTETTTFEVLNDVLQDLLEFQSKEHPKICFNIGHVMYANLPQTEKLLQLVAQTVFPSEDPKGV